MATSTSFNKSRLTWPLAKCASHPAQWTTHLGGSEWKQLGKSKSPPPKKMVKSNKQNSHFFFEAYRLEGFRLKLPSVFLVSVCFFVLLEVFFSVPSLWCVMGQNHPRIAPGFLKWRQLTRLWIFDFLALPDGWKMLETSFLKEGTIGKPQENTLNHLNPQFIPKLSKTMVSWQYLAISPIFWFKINLKPTSLRRWRLMMKEFQLHRLHSTKHKTNWLNPQKNGGPPRKKLLSSNLLPTTCLFANAWNSNIRWCRTLVPRRFDALGPAIFAESFVGMVWISTTTREKKGLKLGWSYPIRLYFFVLAGIILPSEYCCGFFPPRKMILFKRWSKDSKAQSQSSNWAS